MRSLGRRENPRHRAVAGALSIAAALSVGLLLVVPSAAGAPRASAGIGVVGAWTSSGAAWSNGVVLCVFEPSAPEVAVSASNLANSGISVGITSVEEVSATGAVTGITPSDGMSWTVTNRTSSLWYDESYSAAVRVAPPASATATLGTVDLRVDFLLPITYVEGVTENLSAVTMQLSVSGWPWQASEDHLVVNLGLSPAFPGTEHFAAPTPNGSVVASVSNQSGRSLEYFAPGIEAVAQATTGPAQSTPVAPTWTLGAAGASLALAVGTSVAEFQTLNYTAHVGVFLPATVAGLPLSDYVVVGGVAALVVIVVGFGLRRARRSPSDLVYVEEEEA